MANARYFLPDHPTLKDVYSKSELRSMLISGDLSRSDMVLDDETGLGHLLGDLLAMPYPDVTNMPRRSTSSSSGSGAAQRPLLPPNHEFRADTPLPRAESEYRPPATRRAVSKEREDEGDRHGDFEDEEEYGHEDEDEDEGEDEGATFEDEDEVEVHDGDEPEDFEDSPLTDEDDDDEVRHGAAEEQEDLDADALRLSARSAGVTGGLPRDEWRPGQSAGGFPYQQSSERESSYPEDREPEEMLYQGHPSWFAYPRSLLAFAITVIAAIVSHRFQFGMEWVMLFSSVAGLILLFVGLDRYTCTYFITTRRVEMEYGVIGRNTREVRIRDIRAIDVQQRGWRALLGMGDVRFDSSVSMGPEVYFRNVHRPHTIKELVREMQR